MEGSEPAVIVGSYPLAWFLARCVRPCSHYAASPKEAIDAFTLARAREVGKEGIRVNAVRPGLIETEIHRLHGGIDPALASAVPLGRSGSVEEVAEVILWLASDGASYVHGAVLDVRADAEGIGRSRPGALTRSASASRIPCR